YPFFIQAKDGIPDFHVTGVQTCALPIYQHFGLDGDYFIQKINLAKPIQEKIYAIINDYAQKRKFDMVLDKSDDTNGLLYTKKGVDISDRIVREIERSLRKERLTKKEIAQLEAQDEAEDAYL